jgi:predicted nucleotidyltransferase
MGVYKSKDILYSLDKETYWDIVGRDAILCGWRGSVAHGTHVPSDDPGSYDDLDLMSVVIPGSQYYLGMREWGRRGTKEVVRDVQTKRVGGEVRFDAVHYELKKMVSMLANGNPNVLPLLWMEESFYERVSFAGKMLIHDRHLFSTKRAWHAWRGYAVQQRHNLHKGEHFGHLGAKRKAMFEKVGYDAKAAGHLIRLLRTSHEFLQTGMIQVYREDAEELLAIKRGEWLEDRVLREADRLLPRCESACQLSNLPDQPDWEKINDLVERMLMSHLGLVKGIN